jgi:hypothetical protein
MTFGAGTGFEVRMAGRNVGIGWNLTGPSSLACGQQPHKRQVECPPSAFLKRATQRPDRT